MEDAAAAETSRPQVRQWIRNDIALYNGPVPVVTRELPPTVSSVSPLPSSMFRDSRRENHTTRTAVVADAVFRMRTYATQ